jgi:LysR family transcriptional regulator, glycine cleavage system transcriptional activator
MRRPRLNILRTFEAAGRHLSFALAAAELNISPPAVSQQMRQLEAYLGSPLFVRHGRRLTLSSTGQAYHETVHQAIERLDTVTDQLFPDKQGQQVTIRCTPSVATLWLVPQLGAFHKNHPEIDLSIRTLDAEYGDATAADIDLEIVTLSEPVSDEHTKILLTTSIVPVCAPDFLNGVPRPKEPKDILDFELIHLLGYDEDWHKWFGQFHSEPVKIPKGVKVDGSLIAMEMAQRGEGVMLGRRPFINHLLKSGELIEVFEKPKALHASYYLRDLAQPKRNRARDLVADWLVNLAVE